MKSSDSPRLDRGGGGGYGGVCVYINDLWCRSYSIKNRICDDPDVEILGMTLRPFYLPRKFGCILLFVVYVPPKGPGKAAQAAKTIANCVHELHEQLQYPEAPAIALGDLNQCYLDTVLPGYEQYVKDATRKNNIMDKCYVHIANAYVANVGSPVLTSYHNVVCMTPVYKSKLKRSKPEKKVIRTWTNESREQLKACLDCTDWDTFRDGSLDDVTTITNDYIHFCVQMVVPTKEIKIYLNNKSYATWI